MFSFLKKKTPGPLYPVLKNKAAISVGAHVSFGEFTVLDADGSFIKIGDDCTFDIGVYIRLWGGSVAIGDNTFVGPYSVLYGHGGLTIGKNVLIASHVTCIPENHGFADKNTPIVNQPVSAKGISIADNVWIGTGVVILDNVHIGTGAVIGAGAVVTKDVAAFSVVTGVPARLIYSY